MDTVFLLLAIVVTIQAGSRILSVVSNVLLLRNTRLIDFRVKEHVFQSISEQTSLEYVETPAFQDAIRTAGNVGRESLTLVQRGVYGMIDSLLRTAAFAGVIASFNLPMFFLIMLAAIPFPILQRYWAIQRMRLLEQLTPMERQMGAYEAAISMPSTIRELFTFGAFEHFRSRLRSKFASLHHLHKVFETRQSWSNGLSSVWTELVTGLMLALVIRGLLTGKASLGDLSLAIAGLANVQDALVQSFSASASLQEARLYWGRMQAGLTHHVNPPIQLPQPGIVGQRMPRLDVLEFRDITFRYPGCDYDILQDISFEVPKGHIVAVAGANGSGKSTLLRIVLRQFLPTAGALFWNGIPVRSFAMDDFRNHVSSVSQDFGTYAITAAENIGVGHSGLMHNKSALTRAATIAGVHDLISGLVRGYGTILNAGFVDEEGYRGMSLSGGQWQKMAHARSILGPAELLILDEPTSALDPSGEERFLQELMRGRSYRTVIVATHKRAILEIANTVVLIHEGTVMAIGSHKNLAQGSHEYESFLARKVTGT